MSDARQSIGVNYGQLGDNLPSPREAVALMKAMKIGKVKIYDANPSILRELGNSEIKVCIMLPNDQIPPTAANQSFADAFVRNNVSSFYPQTRIRMLLVGNEVLSESDDTYWPFLVPAMINLHKALRRQKLRKVKVSSPVAMDVLAHGSLFPPSQAAFRSNIAHSVIMPMLRFLHHTNSPLFLDVYPYLTWKSNTNTNNISIDFALFGPNAPPYKDPMLPTTNHGAGAGADGAAPLLYHNLLDLELDAVLTAMSKLGYPKVQLTLSETGWPTVGDLDERGANVYNAATYNRRLVKKVVAMQGTPLRPGTVVETYIFALFNENLKPGPVTERHWGLLYPNGTHIYDIDLTGYLNESDYHHPPPEAAAAAAAAAGKLKLWCVANPEADDATLAAALTYACAHFDCAPIQPHQPCSLPNSTLSHASYAFNAYYNNFQSIGGTCFFGGAANLTAQDPSKAPPFPSPPLPLNLYFNGKWYIHL